MNHFVDYFQIAVMALVFLIIGAKTAYLRIARHVNPIVIGGGHQGLKRIIEPIAMIVFMFWAVEVCLYASHARFRIFGGLMRQTLLSSEFAMLIGVALITVGLFALILAYITFGDSWRVGFDVKSPGTLVTNGIFELTRNPIYLFLDLWFVGTFLVNGTLTFLVFAVAEIAAMHWQIRQEEKFLSRLYGQAYRDYCRRTARYLIW